MLSSPSGPSTPASETWWRDGVPSEAQADLTISVNWRAFRRLLRHLSPPWTTGSGPGKSMRKAEAVAKAAHRLIAAGAPSSKQFDVTSDEQRRAYVGVSGLGHVTWAYLGMLLGQPGVKADTMIRRFVSAAVGRPTVDAARARELIEATAVQMDVLPTDLDHAIWSYQRGRRN